MLQPAQLIAEYNLSPHPEGGWYRQTYRSAEQIAAEALPERFGGSRPFSTAIYFLLEQGNFSAFHRIRSDECWHFYAGGPLEIFIIHPAGNLEVVTMGQQAGQHFQYVVPAECWFASRPVAGTSFSFTGCTVAPGFDFADFELANANILSGRYPQHAELIRSLCR